MAGAKQRLVKLGRRTAAAALLFALSAAAAHAAASDAVAQELWDRPRSGDAILAQPALRQAAGRLLAEPAARLLIHHGGGQEDLLQAIELRAWLAALALDAERIALVGDLPNGGELRLELRE